MLARSSSSSRTSSKPLALGIPSTLSSLYLYTYTLVYAQMHTHTRTHTYIHTCIRTRACEEREQLRHVCCYTTAQHQKNNRNNPRPLKNTNIPLLKSFKNLSAGVKPTESLLKQCTSQNRNNDHKTSPIQILITWN